MRVKNILQYLESTAARLGNKVAISSGVDGETLTFSELLSHARQIGSALIGRGVAHARVAVLMERSPHAVAAMLGVWYAGACSIMLDSSMPKARMQEILTRAQVSLIVSDTAQSALACSFAVPSVTDQQLLTVAPNADALMQIRRAQIDTDPIYMVFTSGSTGVPKGVIACHRSVIDYAQALLDAIDIREDDVLGCQAPLYFDAPLKELLSTIVLGATTYLIPHKCFLFPMLLLDYLKKQRITAVCWVVSAFLQISSLGALEAHPPTTLRTVVFGSEVFPKEHYERWRAALPQATFYQLYGPTEATGMSCVWRADRALEAGERIPIGAPLDNTDVILLSDQGMRILPVPGQMSEQGEIYLRGSCVTLGYDHAPEETAKAFVQNPLHTAYPEIVYKTGDLACYNAHGELEFLGRRDAQIKRMGHRVELGDIEEAALRQDGVQQCCCVYLSDTQQIVLFYTGQISEQDLLRVMQSQLPRYMLPGRVIGVSSIPLTQNGKKDRRALIALVSGARTTNS